MTRYQINWTSDTGNGRGFQVTTLSGRFCGVFKSMSAAIAYCQSNTTKGDSNGTP